MFDQFEQVMVTLTNDKVQFTGVSQSSPNHPIPFDVAPPIGDGQGFNGLELLLASFAGCSSTAMVYLLRKMGKSIAHFKTSAKGLRRNQPPIKLEKIFLEFVITSNDTEESDIQKAIQLAEESVCPVWQMLKNNTEVVTEYKIILP